MNKQIFLGLVMGLMLLAAPALVVSAHAEEIEIQLFEIVGMSPLPR